MRKMIVAALTMVAILVTAPATRADPVADFYRDKKIRMIIGYGAGGGYDLYGRLVAEFLGKHIPGNPIIIPQNMPGGGSFVAAKYLFEAAPKDGTVLGSLSQTLVLDTAAGSVTGIDASQFRYIGRVVTNIDLGMTPAKSGVKSIEDARKREVTVGVTGGASTAVVLPSSLNKYGGTKFKLIRGYKGSTEIVLAMERGEVDMVGAIGVPNLLARHPGWLKGEMNVIYQAALKRHRLLPNVPALPELGTTEDGKKVLRAIASTAEIGRSVVTTPGVPAERVAALRKAFQDMVKDPEFLAQLAKRNIMVDPGTGEELDEIVKETFALPKSILAQVGELTRPKKK